MSKKDKTVFGKNEARASLQSVIDQIKLTAGERKFLYDCIALLSDDAAAPLPAPVQIKKK